MGFFTQSELKKSSAIVVDSTTLESECHNCGLYIKKQHPKIEISGEGKKGILIIGDHTTEEDDLYGIAFSGEEGDFLSRELRQYNILLNRDCWKVKAVRCYSDSKPDAKHAFFCAPYLEKIIATKKPKVIILFGPTVKYDDSKNNSLAITSLFGHEFSDRGILTWRNFCIPSQKYKCHIFPLLGPLDILNNPKDKNKKELFKRDLNTCCNKILSITPVETRDYEKNILLVKDIKTLTQTLKNVIDTKKQITYDYETTGLKPFKLGHKIVTISFATNEHQVYSFPYEYRDFWTETERQEIYDLWKAILKDKEIKKVAFNSKFEEVWGAVKFKQRHLWHFDPMICNHILDNRPMINSLTFLCMVRLGISPYDKEMKKYLQSEDEFNTAEKAPLNDLLLYNGYDVIYTQLLYEMYIKDITKAKGLLKAYNFFMRGNKEMAELQINGISMNTLHYKKVRKELSRRIESIQKRLETGREARAFEKKYNRPIMLTSNQDLGDLFYGILGQTPVYTGKGNYKTDKATLEKINLPFVKKLFEKKKYEKALGTYLAQFEREISEKKKIHPFFDLHIPVSYRSASSRPNFQNQPKREKEIKIMIRSGMVPKKDSVLSEMDFSGAEVIAAASNHRDPKFISYLKDKTTDMHRDCYDKETKILTKDGFKYYHEILDDEKIGQYNPEIGKIEFVTFLDRIYYDYEGDMYHIQNKHFDTYTTPNHRMYLRKKNTKYFFIKAKDIKRSRYYSMVSADVKYRVDIPEFYFEAVYGTGRNSTKKYQDKFKIKPNDMFELLGYLITDGHFKYHKQGAYRINLSQIKEPHKSKMKSCIDRIKSYTNFNFHEEKHIWSMSNKNFCIWLCDNFGINKINRKLPDFIKYAPIEQLQIFFEACVVGDGLWYKSKTSGRFCLISKQLIDDFQFICMRLGYATSLYKHVLKGNRTTQVYSLNIRQMNESIIRNQLSIKHYSGKVFCFTVPSGLLVTQRNNKISIQGNCASDLLDVPHEMFEKTDDYTDEQKKAIKEIRFFAKNTWTFAQFYGDWYGSCAPNFWANVVEAGLLLPNGVSCKDWLEKKGIYELGTFESGQPTPGSFLEHCKGVEHKMWYQRFPQYTQWKKDIVEFYQKYGYIESLFGFRFVGLMSNNQCTNFPIQSASFHLLLYTLIEVQRVIKKLKLKTKLIGQVHDSIIGHVPEDEIVIYHSEVHKIVSNLRKVFPWLVVPMEIGAEISKLGKDGGNFAELREVDPTNAKLWY